MPTTRKATSESRSAVVVDAERVVGRQQEEVPGEEGEDGGEDGRAGAADAGHEHDDEQVEDGPLAFGEEVTAGEEDEGRQGDGDDGEQVAVACSLSRSRPMSGRLGGPLYARRLGYTSGHGRPGHPSTAAVVLRSPRPGGRPRPRRLHPSLRRGRRPHRRGRGLSPGRRAQPLVHRQDPPQRRALRSARPPLRLLHVRHALLRQCGLRSGGLRGGECCSGRSSREQGLDRMAERRGIGPRRALLCSGPARLAQALGIGREQNGMPAWVEPLVVLPRERGRRAEHRGDAAHRRGRRRQAVALRRCRSATSRGACRADRSGGRETGRQAADSAAPPIPAGPPRTMCRCAGRGGA